MDINTKKKSILKKAIGVVSGVVSGAKKAVKTAVESGKEIIENNVAIKNATREAKNNINELAIKKAKSIYTKKTGREMTPLRLSLDREGMLLPKDTQEYLNNKKKIIRDYYTKFKL